MFSSPQRSMIIPSSPPSEPRLLLASDRGDEAVLDGGWWPRSWDPAAELPGLVLALSERYGRILNVMLNRAAWDSRFRRLAVGTGVVRVGWFTTLAPTLLIAATDRGEQIELLVVPPSASAAVAKRAMTTAANPTNIMRAPDILAAKPGATGSDGAKLSVGSGAAQDVSGY
jgi:hypothetical protein